MKKRRRRRIKTTSPIPRPACHRDDEWTLWEARNEVRRYSEKIPGYSEAVSSIKDALCEITGRYRDMNYGRDKRHHCEDESNVQLAAVSLGMGTKNLPSNQYRR
ncbi:hypothetical protein OAK55_01455 [Akkermansiaceae bacterium]|nr:hypothetical protein [Akkermansiaceae bacterium]